MLHKTAGGDCMTTGVTVSLQDEGSMEDTIILAIKAAILKAESKGHEILYIAAYC